MVVVDSYITDDCQNLNVSLAIEKAHALLQYQNLHIILSNLVPVDSLNDPLAPDLYNLGQSNKLF